MPLVSVIRKYPGIHSHTYVDDTQIYLSFSTKLTFGFSVIESCIRDKFSLMISHKLHVDLNKTKNLLFNP